MPLDIFHIFEDFTPTLQKSRIPLVTSRIIGEILGAEGEAVVLYRFHTYFSTKKPCPLGPLMNLSLFAISHQQTAPLNGGRELGISLTELARRLRISVSGVGYSVERGEIIACENDYQLIE